MSAAKIKVLVVDDSAVVRQVLSEILQSDAAIDLLGTASDPLFAMEKMKKAWPDVLVLDIEMPRMDGLTFLKKIMTEHPTPVVICSTLTERGADITLQALAAGAAEIITKPKMGLKGFLQESAQELLAAVKAAAKANVKNLGRAAKGPPPLAPQPKLTADVILSAGHAPASLQTTEKIVAIGTSTGGTQALEVVLTGLPRVSPGIVIVQHMPEKFTKAFADRLNGLCEVTVKEGQNNDRVIPGTALIAPGGAHMVLKRSGAYYFVEIVNGPLVSRHRPSVDVLFRSVAKFAGKNALGIIMTGMGDDGVRGLLEMRNAGSPTLAQNEETCVVYGMPKEAVKAGAADRLIGLDEIPKAILDFSRKG